MSRPFRIHTLDLTTARATTTYTFAPGVNAVIGSYKTGKSSMLELIKFALGGAGAQIMPTIAQNLLSTTLEISLAHRRYLLHRAVGQNVVTVTDDDGRVEQWTATQGKLPRAGTRLLEVLDIPTVRLSKNNDKGSEPLTFFDVLRSMYLPQSDVNSSVAGHKDTFLNRKRKAAFELIYGLADDRTRELEVAGVELQRRLDRANLESAAVRKFLREVGAPDEVELAADEVTTRERFRDAETRLTQARSDASSHITGDQVGLRARIAQLRTDVADLEAEHQAVSSSIALGRSVLAQLDLDEERFHREIYVALSISGLEFAICPRCLQNVSGRHLDPGHCLLCTQPQPVRPTREADDTLRRIKAQRDETEGLLREDQQRAAHVAQRLNVGLAALDEAAGELERQANPGHLFPSIDQASSAAADREQARSRLRDIERFRDLWSHYERLELETVRLTRMVAANADEQARHQRELAEHRSRITELGEIFDEEVRQLQYRGYESASIDDQTYLPTINGDIFDKLSVSGASKTLANVAYYLANTGYSSTNADFLLPGLLILDSPRTSLGDTAEDIAAGRRIYYRIDVLALAYPNLQIIVADNGLPTLESATRRRFNIVELTYARPLLQDVRHPGVPIAEEEERSIQRTARSSR